MAHLHTKCHAGSNVQHTHIGEAELWNDQRIGAKKWKAVYTHNQALKTFILKHSFCQALLNHLPKLRWKKIYKHGVWLYVMPAVSQSEPQDAYREAEKTNTQGCPFCILDVFPSRKYQSSPEMLQNRFTLNRPVILPYKGLNTLDLRLCVYVYTCLSVRRRAERNRLKFGGNFSHSW